MSGVSEDAVKKALADCTPGSACWDTYCKRSIKGSCEKQNWILLVLGVLFVVGLAVMLFVPTACMVSSSSQHHPSVKSSCSKSACSSSLYSNPVYAVVAEENADMPSSSSNVSIENYHSLPQDDSGQHSGTSRKNIFAIMQCAQREGCMRC